MADNVTVDTSELQRLSVDLGKAAAGLFPQAVRIMEHAAVNIKTEMVADAQESPHFHQVGRTITYDRADKVGEVAFEIGPDRDRGASAGLAGAYYGWPNGGGATLPLDAPLDHEAPNIEKAVLDLLDGLL